MYIVKLTPSFPGNGWNLDARVIEGMKDDM
jgi:hypothetical protein